MSVFTPVSEREAESFLEQFALGAKDGTTRGRVAYSPDGRFLVRTQEQPHTPGGFRGRVYLRDLGTRATTTSEEIPDTLDAVSFLPSGTEVIVNGQAAAYLLRLPDLAVQRTYPLPPGALGGHLSVAPDGSSFARARIVPGTKPGEAPRSVRPREAGRLVRCVLLAVVERHGRAGVGGDLGDGFSGGQGNRAGEAGRAENVVLERLP